MSGLIWKRKTSSRPPLSQGGDHGSIDGPGYSAAASLPSGRNVPPSAPAASAAASVNGVMAGRQQPWSASQIRLLAPELARRWFVPAARISIFVIYFWFGLLKLIGVSPATPLASALVAHTIGLSYFGLSFKALAIYECAVGILFLVPAATEISVVLLVIHMGIVSSPLILVAQDAWTHPLVPTFEGQYIIKDLALIALAIGILAYAPARRAAAGPATVNLAGQVPAPRLGEPELGPAGRAAAGSKREPASGPPSRSGGG